MDLLQSLQNLNISDDKPSLKPLPFTSEHYERVAQALINASKSLEPETDDTTEKKLQGKAQESKRLDDTAEQQFGVLRDPATSVSAIPPSILTTCHDEPHKMTIAMISLSTYDHKKETASSSSQIKQRAHEEKQKVETWGQKYHWPLLREDSSELRKQIVTIEAGSNQEQERFRTWKRMVFWPGLRHDSPSAQKQISEREEEENEYETGRYPDNKESHTENDLNTGTSNVVVKYKDGEECSSKDNAEAESDNGCWIMMKCASSESDDIEESDIENFLNRNADEVDKLFDLLEESVSLKKEEIDEDTSTKFSDDRDDITDWSDVEADTKIVRLAPDEQGETDGETVDANSADNNDDKSTRYIEEEISQELQPFEDDYFDRIQMSTCEACATVWESSDMTLLDCDHTFCMACLNKTFIAATRHSAAYPPSCCSPIQWEDVYLDLDDLVLKEFLDKEVDGYAVDNED